MIAKLFSMIVGYGVFFGLMYGILKVKAGYWNRLAEKYAVDPSDRPLSFAKRNMQTVFVAETRLKSQSYLGITTVSVTRDGIFLSLIPPFSIFHRPLLIPFGDCRVEPSRWYLFGNASYQFTLSQVKGVQIIINDDLQEWIVDQLKQLSKTPTCDSAPTIESTFEPMADDLSNECDLKPTDESIVCV